MRKTIIAAMLATTAICASTPAFAYRDHVRVQKIPAPACTVMSPNAYQVSGIFFSRLGGPKAWVPTAYGRIANPYPGLNDINVLIGSEGNNSTVTYRFAKPARYFQLAWGSLDKGNWIWFYRGETLIGRTNGEDVARQLGITLTPGSNPSETLLMRTSEPYDTVVFGSNETAFEWADMRRDDLPMCQP